MSRAGRKTRRRRSAVLVDSRPGWQIMRDFYMKRFSEQLENK